jgi:hypothetical protein
MNMDPGPLPAFLDRTKLVHSFSAISCYENVCPYQYFQTYILKAIPYVETPERKKGNQAHAALAKRVGVGAPLPPEMAQWESFCRPFDGLNARTELKLGITDTGASVDYWDKNSVWFRGALDTTVVNNTSAYLNDWKLVKNPQYTKRFELEVHALLLHASQPSLTSIKGTYTFLQQGAISEVYDLSNTAETWRKVKDITKRIERDRARGEFEKREGPLCAWCDCLACEFNRKKK